MKLLIISNMSHYLTGDRIVGWGPTVQEIDHLATVFDEVRHIGCLHNQQAPESSLPYAAGNVTFLPVSPAGGEFLRNKLEVLRLMPHYANLIFREVRNCDVIHVRCPANISMLAVVLLAFFRHPRRRWIKYAGNWRPSGSEVWSSTFQRWWLRKGWHRGVVTVNGEWPDQPCFVHTFLNPCLNYVELLEGRHLIETRQISSPVRLIFVGRLDRAKGVARTLDTMARLKEIGVCATLDLVGDGEERLELEQLARSLGVASEVSFHGWLPRTALGQLYSRAHLILLPSTSEGWPKVLSEAMAYGAVPVASNVSSIPQYLQRFDTGRSLDPADITSFAQTIGWYLKHPGEWKRESENGQRAAELFSYDNYLKAVHKLLRLPRAARFETNAPSEVLQPDGVA